MGTWGGKEAPCPSLLQVAVKLSGWRWRGRQALRLYPRVELGTVVDTVLALLEKLEEEESVLVEAVCPPARLPFPGESHPGQPGAGAGLGLQAAPCWAQAARLSPGSPPPGPALAVRICAVVCRTQGDRPLLSKVSVARVQVLTLLPRPSPALMSC